MRKLRYPNVEAERARHGYSVEEVAKYLGVTSITYRNYFIDCKSVKIPYSIVRKLGTLYRCSSDYLMSEDEVEGTGLNLENCWTKAVNDDGARVSQTAQ